MDMLSKSRHAALITVKNMNRAINFYTRALGGSLNMRGTGEMKDGWASLNVGRAEFWLVKPDRREKLKLAYNTFAVKDIKAEVTGLKRRGVKFAPAERMGPKDKVDGPITYSTYGASAFFWDSEGNALMLWQSMM